MFRININILIIALFFTILLGCDNTITNNNGEQNVDETEPYVPKLVYGVYVDTLQVITGKVKKNEFLSDILLKYGINYGDIDYIARNTKHIFDVRKIVAGNNYSVICSSDSIQKALYFAYELSPSKYVLYSFGDSITVQHGQKEIVTKTDTTTGVISSSLWNAMVDNGADPNLSNDLSETYAWTIDFFGLQKGDTYKVIYEKLFVDSTYVGLKKVVASMFYHGGDSLYAFYFEQDGKGDYFDEHGNSLQRTFLKAPLRFTRISSRFSNSRMHPVLKIRRP
ncbi:MAG: metalloendopeptidase, partial [Bacteroidota bacterium]